MKKEKHMIAARWLGAAGIELTAGGQTVLIDPYISRPGKFDIFFSRLTPDSDLIARYLETISGTPAAVVVGHTHVDHALDIPVIAQESTCPVIGGRNLDVLLAMHGLAGRVTVCDIGRAVSPAEDISIEMIPSAHGRVLLGKVPYPGNINPDLRPPLKSADYRLGECYIPKITMAGKTFMHVGSANFIPETIIGHTCDVLFLCVPGWRRIPGYPEALLDALAPETVIPFHFDDFTTPLPASNKVKQLPFLKMRGLLDVIYDHAPHLEVCLPEPGRQLFFG